MSAKEQRLTRQKDFQGVFSKGKSVREGQLVLKARFVQGETAKFGIVVSKKVAKQAVVRNRIRRVLRAALSAQAEAIKKGVQAVLIVLPGFEEKGAQELRTQVHRLLQKASLFQ